MQPIDRPDPAGLCPTSLHDMLALELTEWALLMHASLCAESLSLPESKRQALAQELAAALDRVAVNRPQPAFARPGLTLFQP